MNRSPGLKRKRWSVPNEEDELIWTYASEVNWEVAWCINNIERAAMKEVDGTVERS
jgi:hypothetical protein